MKLLIYDLDCKDRGNYLIARYERTCFKMQVPGAIVHFSDDFLFPGKSGIWYTGLVAYSSEYDDVITWHLTNVTIHDGLDLVDIK